MRATWRPLPAWPHPPRRRLAGNRFRSAWQETLEQVEEEIGLLKGGDVIIGFVGTEDQVNFSGNLKRGAQTRFAHRGIEISFDTPSRGRLIFQTDAFDDVRQNLRAIGLGLTALRAVGSVRRGSRRRRPSSRPSALYELEPGVPVEAGARAPVAASPRAPDFGDMAAVYTVVRRKRHTLARGRL